MCALKTTPSRARAGPRLVLSQRWSRIRDLLPERNGHSIKNRYHSLTRQRVSIHGGSQGLACPGAPRMPLSSDRGVCAAVSSVGSAAGYPVGALLGLGLGVPSVEGGANPMRMDGALDDSSAHIFTQQPSPGGLAGVRPQQPGPYGPVSSSLTAFTSSNMAAVLDQRRRLAAILPGANQWQQLLTTGLPARALPPRPAHEQSNNIGCADIGATQLAYTGSEQPLPGQHMQGQYQQQPPPPPVFDEGMQLPQSSTGQPPQHVRSRVGVARMHAQQQQRWGDADLPSMSTGRVEASHAPLAMPLGPPSMMQPWWQPDGALLLRCTTTANASTMARADGSAHAQHQAGRPASGACGGSSFAAAPSGRNDVTVASLQREHGFRTGTSAAEKNADHELDEPRVQQLRSSLPTGAQLNLFGYINSRAPARQAQPGAVRTLCAQAEGAGDLPGTDNNNGMDAGGARGGSASINCSVHGGAASCSGSPHHPSPSTTLQMQRQRQLGSARACAIYAAGPGTEHPPQPEPRTVPSGQRAGDPAGATAAQLHGVAHVSATACPGAPGSEVRDGTSYLVADERKQRICELTGQMLVVAQMSGGDEREELLDGMLEEMRSAVTQTRTDASY